MKNSLQTEKILKVSSTDGNEYLRLKWMAAMPTINPRTKDKPPTPPPDDPGNPTVNFRGERRSNETHASKTDPEALLVVGAQRRRQSVELSYCGNLLLENRNGQIVYAEVFQANGTVERDAALVMLEKLPGIQSVTVGGDKGLTRGIS